MGLQIVSLRLTYALFSCTPTRRYAASGQELTHGSFVEQVLLGAMLGSLLTGYASSVISNTLGQPSWFTQMGLAGDDQQTTNIISAANGLFYAGGFFGTIFTYGVSERWGRLMGLKVAAGWAILGGALQAGAMNIPMVSSNGDPPLHYLT